MPSACSGIPASVVEQVDSTLQCHLVVLWESFPSTVLAQDCRVDLHRDSLAGDNTSSVQGRMRSADLAEEVDLEE